MLAKPIMVAGSVAYQYSKGARSQPDEAGRRREICYTIESCPETSKYGLSLTTERQALTVLSSAVSLMRPVPGR